MDKKKVILVIMDGIGLNPKLENNAVALAKTPTLDELIKNYPYTTLHASEEWVGLPKGQMGNSEVGHLNIGAGRIVYTGLSLINKDLEDGKFFKNKALLAAISYAKKHESKFHIMGLCSYGGVHSSLNHILALIELAAKHKVQPILHCFTDGRDVNPKSFINDLPIIIGKLKECNGKLASISGRYYAMDRDKRWDRIQKAYDVIIGKSASGFMDPIKYVKNSYDQGTTDEFIVPAINKSVTAAYASIEDNDAVVFANFRPDRARQLSHVLFGSKYYDYKPELRRKNLFFVTMMNYEGIVPSAVAYPPQDIKNTFGKVIASNHLKQLRIAETEKYAHVTFFFDGGKEIDYPNEQKVLVNSPKVATYDLKPEMSAIEVCDKLIEHMADTDVIIVNFANGDMVGHTGNLKATIEAVETVDTQVGKIYKKSLETNTTMFIIADHGNAEVMKDDKGNVVTKHTTNPVPFIITDRDVIFAKSTGPLGSLCDVAPTILTYLKIKLPKEMTGKNLAHKF